MIQPTFYRLTLGPLVPPMAKLLGKAALFSFIGLVILFSLIVVLSGMVLQLWYVPVAMAAVMVVVMFAVLVPVVGGFCWLLTAMTRYRLAEEGVSQGAGPVARQVSWLEFRRIETTTLAGVTIVRMIAGELDPPITIYHSLLMEPAAFWHRWLELLPQTSTLYGQTQQLVADLLNESPSAGPTKPQVPLRPAHFSLPPFQ